VWYAHVVVAPEQRSVDKFVSIFGMTDHAAAFAVDTCEVHILIDLNGHSKGARYNTPPPSLSMLPCFPALVAISGFSSVFCTCLLEDAIE
jgi:hypothetical protein